MRCCREIVQSNDEDVDTVGTNESTANKNPNLNTGSNPKPDVVDVQFRRMLDIMSEEEYITELDPTGSRSRISGMV